MTDQTYPGTDLLIRLCFGCQKEIIELSDMWLDFDSNCCVCTECRESVRIDYATTQEWTASIVKVTPHMFQTINELDEG